MNQDMIFYGRKVLFLGAHPDDIELGCGALIAQIVSRADILCVTLSDNQKNPTLNKLVDEHYHSMRILGVHKDCIELGKFETRNFPQVRQEILEYLIRLNRTYQPEIVFVHSKADIHQDHATVTEEALRAFRGTTVLGFDVLRSTYGFFPNFLVGVSEREVDLKVKALKAYETYSEKYYFDPEVTRATLKRQGALAERQYAEGFDILRVIAKFLDKIEPKG